MALAFFIPTIYGVKLFKESIYLYLFTNAKTFKISFYLTKKLKFKVWEKKWDFFLIRKFRAAVFFNLVRFFLYQSIDLAKCYRFHPKNIPITLK